MRNVHDRAKHNTRIRPSHAENLQVSRISADQECCGEVSMGAPLRTPLIHRPLNLHPANAGFTDLEWNAACERNAVDRQRPDMGAGSTPALHSERMRPTQGQRGPTRAPAPPVRQERMVGGRCMPRWSPPNRARSQPWHLRRRHKVREDHSEPILHFSPTHTHTERDRESASKHLRN